MDTTLIVPGLNGSGADHWQTWLERKIPGAVRVIQRDWHDAYLPHWSARVRRELNRVPGQIFIVAHSFGCLAAAQATFDYQERVRGLMLVAPADPDRFGAAAYLPERPLGVPAVVVASTNDPWMRFSRAADWSDTWGAELINLGAAGHINPDAGFGHWPEGLAILRRLRRDATALSERWLPEESFLQLGEL
jgi:predicted alpha/beta hydrolase family esterase